MDFETFTDEIANIANTPKINEADYLADPYFAPIYSYLKNDNLPIDNATARKILFTSENYYIEGHLLYKVSLPRGKKEHRARPQNYLLCIPKRHTAVLLKEWHSILVHYGPNRLIPTLSTRFYWPQLLVDIKKCISRMQYLPAIQNSHKSKNHTISSSTSPQTSFLVCFNGP